ncbi:uncharacterized protein MYCFIDRAFT_210767 [Pseudocercospora fijiensis CIRAD86]|uniref:Uncharacterized protein n=1 Tax=Pseudocercospora fijiensis (strain CIRAD86) TaxID=383855 RepID=M2Z2H0_PSEFD|nr:uncharacterized protein MYCFIDRAFT_210767 [Pseudocercospora fijiensis CIRAD86]EME84040.1 hypothetical protein MYCFIDRAFT_210767 [Pseudocercospora fijiensis CIRAD86]
MPPTHLLQTRDSDSDSNFETYRLIILIFAIIVLITSILSSIFVYRARTKMLERRKALGCHCYDDLSACWTPWWYWALARCTCDDGGVKGNGNNGNNDVPLTTYQRTSLPTYQQSQEERGRYGVPVKRDAGREGS